MFTPTRSVRGFHGPQLQTVPWGTQGRGPDWVSNTELMPSLGVEVESTGKMAGSPQKALGLLLPPLLSFSLSQELSEGDVSGK